MTETATASASTHQRIIDAASELFASHGYENVTIRQICRAAGANIAAVNYHFRDKEGLYREVVLGAYRAARERYPLDAGVTDNDPPERRLRAVIKGFLGRVFDDGSPPWGKLLAREMVDPSGALDGVVQEGARPQFELLLGIVRELMGHGVSDRDAQRAALSVVSQVAFYHTCRNVLQRMLGASADGRAQIDALADHIVRFSLPALRGYRADGAERGVAAP